jgi:pyruvate,water dikinase
MYDMLTRIGSSAGVTDIAGLTGGYGGGVPEAAVVAELWAVSRGRTTVEDLVAQFGYHGPLEGELSSRVWREDDTPLRRLAEQYAGRPVAEDPVALQAVRQAERERLEQQVVSGSPRPARPILRSVLKHAGTTIPLRGVAKGSFLQVFDVLRAAARRAGELHAAAGVLDDPDDIFYLRADEVQERLRPDVREVTAWRRARREEHLRVRIPTEWVGMPTPIASEDELPRDVLAGTGVSHGVAEGVARVVTDPADAVIDHGDILVSATTDPSWASIMFLSGALVVDIGGHLSHAAVVARELGIPCVVNTIDGSRVLRSGDRIRVDGDKGTVEVLARAPTAAGA